jgi:hypothetical protein
LEVCTINKVVGFVELQLAREDPSCELSLFCPFFPSTFSFCFPLPGGFSE